MDWLTALEAYKLPVKGCWLVSTLQSLAGEKAFETRTQPDGFILHAGSADGAEAREPEGLGTNGLRTEPRPAPRTLFAWQARPTARTVWATSVCEEATVLLF